MEINDLHEVIRLCQAVIEAERCVSNPSDELEQAADLAYRLKHRLLNGTYLEKRDDL